MQSCLNLHTVPVSYPRPKHTAWSVVSSPRLGFISPPTRQADAMQRGLFTLDLSTSDGSRSRCSAEMSPALPENRTSLRERAGERGWSESCSARRCHDPRAHEHVTDCRNGRRLRRPWQGKDRESYRGLPPLLHGDHGGLLVQAPRAQMPRAKMRRMRARVKDRMCLTARGLTLLLLLKLQTQTFIFKLINRIIQRA